MTAVAITASGHDWRFLPETPPREADRFQALLLVQLRDEFTGVPPRGAMQVTTAMPGAAPIFSPGGLIGLAGRPAAILAEPWPAPAPRAKLRAIVAGYLPLEIDADLGPQPGMPVTFTPRDLGTIDLHRLPTRVTGRVISRATGPVGGATVQVATIWPTLAGIVGAGQDPNALTLWAGLYADRPAGAPLRRQTLTLLAAPKRLLRSASAGASRIRISDRQNLVIGRPLAIEPGDPERQEFIVVTAVDTSSSDDQPTEVTLAHPLRRGHSAGVDVARTSLAAAGPANATVSAARAGDVSILTDGLDGITLANTTVEISGGGPLPEYHGFALWRAVSAADGTFRLPPIHRVAHLELTGPAAADPMRVTLSTPGDARADMVFD